MSLQYSLESNGQSGELTAGDLVEQFKGQGYQNVQLSPDGMKLTYDHNGETYDGNVPDVLAGLGHTVKGMVPTEFEESFIQPEWRRGLQALPDDNEARSTYIKSKLNKMGLQGEVVGSGDDWYFHNPQTGKWYATTNAKGFDMSDLQEAVNAPQIAGSIIGGGLGAAGGGIFGGMAGAGLGDLAGRGLTKTVLRGLDPEVDETLSTVGGPWGALPIDTSDLKDAGLSSLGGALGGIPALTKVLNSGTLTGIGRPLGSAIEGAGSLTSRVGGTLANSNLAKQFGTALIPGLNQAQLGGLALRAGELAPWLSRTFGKGASKVASMADDAIVKGGLNAEEAALAQSISNKARLAADKAAMREVPLTGIDDGGMLGRLNRRIFGGGKVEEGARELAEEAGKTRGFYENMGFGFDKGRREFLRKAEERAAGMSPVKATAFMDKVNAKAGKGVQPAFNSLGKAAEGASRAGRALEGAAEGVTGLGFRGIQGVGMAAEQGGKLLKGGSRFLQPFENRLYLNQGMQRADEGAETLQEMMRKRRPQVAAFSQ